MWLWTQYCRRSILCKGKWLDECSVDHYVQKYLLMAYSVPRTMLEIGNTAESTVSSQVRELTLEEVRG